MNDNPFEPPRTRIAAQAGVPRPAAVLPLAVLSLVFMIFAVVIAVVSRPLVEAIIVVFFSAFLWFVPVGLLMGRHWAPAAATAAGLFVAVFAFGSLLLSWNRFDAVGLAFRVAAGIFALVLAGAMLWLRRDRYFSVVVVREDGGG